MPCMALALIIQEDGKHFDGVRRKCDGDDGGGGGDIGEPRTRLVNAQRLC